MVTSKNFYFLDQVRLTYAVPGTEESGLPRSYVEVVVSRGNVDFCMLSPGEGSCFGLLPSDVGLIAAFCRQLREPATWKEEE